MVSLSPKLKLIHIMASRTKSLATMEEILHCKSTMKNLHSIQLNSRIIKFSAMMKFRTLMKSKATLKFLA